MFFSNELLFFQGDLGAIDEKYDIAISSSCGALDNIVVDTIDTAQKCVTFLKEQNIGVATFIGLDKVKILPVVFAAGVTVQTRSMKCFCA